MAKKTTQKTTRRSESKEKAQRADSTPPLAPVVVVTIVYSPPLGQTMAVTPHFPARMSVNDMLHVLRSAEEALIASEVAGQLQQQAEQTALSPASSVNK